MQPVKTANWASNVSRFLLAEQVRFSLKSSDFKGWDPHEQSI